MTSGISIGKAIYSLLSGFTGLTYYVDNKIFPVVVDDETINPYIMFERTVDDSFYSKDGIIYDEVSLTVNVVSDDYAESVEISEQVRDALEGTVGTFSGVKIIQMLLSNVSEDFGADNYLSVLQFAIKAK